VLLYHPWSLNPEWRKSESATRILILEPSHFQRFPISPRRMAFLLALSRNIPGLTLFAGEVGSLPGLEMAECIVSQAHQSQRHFPGQKDSPAWLFPQWPEKKAMPGSFMSFWKQAERWL